jgi:hypothetical protein
MTEDGFDTLMADAEKQLGIKHRDDVSWYKDPLPPRWHRHSVQTWQTGVFGEVKVERCPCGAIRLDGRGWWMERNSRRKGRR